MERIIQAVTKAYIEVNKLSATINFNPSLFSSIVAFFLGRVAEIFCHLINLINEQISKKEEEKNIALKKKRNRIEVR